MASANNRLVTSEMELRHLNISEKLRLSEILDRNESWVKLMEAIPRDILDAQPLNRDTKIARRKYSSDNIRTIAEESKLRSYSPTMILLDEWGTSGRKRATVSDLLNVLVKVELFRAADFIAENVLAETRPERPANGPSARYPIIDPELLERQDIDSFLNQAAYPNTTNLERSDNRSYMNNRKNSKSNDFDPIKSMGGIDMSTRDDNPPDTHDFSIDQCLYDLHVQNGRPNSEQSIAAPHVESLAKHNLDFIGNGSINDASTAHDEDSSNITSGSCHDKLSTPLNSMEVTDDNQSSEFSPNNIPNLTELMPNS